LLSGQEIIFVDIDFFVTQKSRNIRQEESRDDGGRKIKDPHFYFFKINFEAQKKKMTETE